MQLFSSTWLSKSKFPVKPNTNSKQVTIPLIQKLKFAYVCNFGKTRSEQLGFVWKMIMDKFRTLFSLVSIIPGNTTIYRSTIQMAPVFLRRWHPTKRRQAFHNSKPSEVIMISNDCHQLKHTYTHTHTQFDANCKNPEKQTRLNVIDEQYCKVLHLSFNQSWILQSDDKMQCP